MARVGLAANSGASSSALQTWQPAFTISPGESGRTVVQRILAGLPDAMRFDQDGGDIIDLDAGDPTDYEYGTSGAGAHIIVSGHYRELGPSTNRARILGATAFAEAFDYDDIAATGERAAVPVRDLNLTTNDMTEDRAGFDLHDAQIHARRDEVDVFGVNCGQELYDVVEITDPQAGLIAAKRRVLGLRWRFETFRTGRYDMTLVLGEV
jgi:hypothetical protein